MLPEPRMGAEAAFVAGLDRVARRLRLGSVAAAAIAASAAAALPVVLFSAVGATPAWSRAASAVMFVACFAACATIWVQRWTPTRTATTIEGRIGGFDNVIVTAAERAEDAGRRPLHRVVSDALWDAAAARLETVRLERVQPLAGPLATAVASVAAAVLLALYAPAMPIAAVDPNRAPDAQAARAPSAGDIRVTLRPPAYASRDARTLVNPTDIVVLEGTVVRLETGARPSPVRLVEPGQPTVTFEEERGAWHHEFVARASRVLLVQDDERGGAGRLLNVRVEADRRPIVRIEEPGKDLLLPDANSQVTVNVVAQDDLGLASLVLRYTRVEGSGESFTFEEGEAPIVLERRSPTEWRARATLPLQALKVEDGDTLVYRAVATDRKPGADPSASETFLIEVGRIGGVATAGFALPDERDRQAISQQMVIVKTERLHKERASLTAEIVLERARLLAIEQRMVKSEFVFMTGGEVEDEVAEAEAGHELAEGRGENQSQVDLLAAIREMSRAEARLNAGDTAQALVFERAALRALQRAFDRRRYLLRTLPERTRIDSSRRLTGDLKDARSSSRDAPPHEPDRLAVAARAALQDLGRAMNRGLSPDPALASRLLAIDPESADLRRAALTLSTATDRSALDAAARDAARLLTGLIYSRVSASARGAITDDALTGRLADIVPSPGGPR